MFRNSQSEVYAGIRRPGQNVQPGQAKHEREPPKSTSLRSAHRISGLEHDRERQHPDMALELHRHVGYGTIDDIVTLLTLLTDSLWSSSDRDVYRQDAFS